MLTTDIRRALGALLLCGALLPAAVLAQAKDASHTAPPPEIGAVRASTPIVLDGRLDEAAWSAARPATDFRQREPRESEPATQRTEVRFLFDDDALYVGARMHDTEGAAGVRTRLVRRDAQLDSDYLNVVLDTYHDHVGYAIFTINPSGVKRDALNGDLSWDPVWQAEARVDSAGWTAELRIPFAQLRFTPGAEQVWGLQVDRQVTRLNEYSVWSFWPVSESGGPTRFGHLQGLEVKRRPGRAEIAPYVVAQSSHLAPGAPGDPFYQRNEQGYRVGVDVKYLLTSNLTLSATLNPDFGQVEVDPAVVNLSAFETFFPERRPFFVEGSGYFGFSPMWCISCSNTSNLGLFYSRRIGRTPQGAGLAYEAGQFADVPDNTTILGAAKVTGKTRNGWSIAMLDALTQREQAVVVDAQGSRFHVPVEPMSNYFVTRVKRDMRGGNLSVGGIATSTYRNLETDALRSRLSRNAESVGVDAEAWWKNRTYHLLWGMAVSQVSGDSAAMLRLQRSSARYFQRPDRAHGSNGLFSDAYQPGLETLRGYGVYGRLAKDGGNFRWDLATNVRSPGFEVNDIAYLSRTDLLWMNGNVMQQWTKPTRYFRDAGISMGAQQQFNYDGDLTDRQVHSFAFVTLPNYWNASLFGFYRPEVFDDRLTRGGPVVKRPSGRFVNLSLSTDSRKQVVLSTNPYFSREAGGDLSYSLNLSARYKPASNVSLSLGPAYGRSNSLFGYVGAREDATATDFAGRRYLFADLEQQTLSMDTRLGVTFSPTLSLEVFAQPFIASGRYTDFKEFVRPRSLETRVFGRDVGTIAVQGSGAARAYRIDPDGTGPAAALTVDDPDFNYRSLRGNAVLRWEYRPGSTLFLVWQQQRDDVGHFGDMRFDRDRRALLGAPSDNVFLIKVNYWLGM